jgi:HEAT repeat protein
MIARKFADPDPAVRRELVVKILARQEVVDGRPWLLRLLGDRDRTVRLAAASVLATSSDPVLKKELRKRAIGEGDVEVRALLEQASEP